MYTIYSILFIVFIILIIVTAFITVALTYFQLAVEDHRCACALFGQAQCPRLRWRRRTCPDVCMRVCVSPPAAPQLVVALLPVRRLHGHLRVRLLLLLLPHAVRHERLHAGGSGQARASWLSHTCARDGSCCTAMPRIAKGCTRHPNVTAWPACTGQRSGRYTKCPPCPSLPARKPSLLRLSQLISPPLPPCACALTRRRPSSSATTQWCATPSSSCWAPWASAHRSCLCATSTGDHGSVQVKFRALRAGLALGHVGFTRMRVGCKRRFGPWCVGLRVMVCVYGARVPSVSGCGVLPCRRAIKCE